MRAAQLGPGPCLKKLSSAETRIAGGPAEAVLCKCTEDHGWRLTVDFYHHRLPANEGECQFWVLS